MRQDLPWSIWHSPMYRRPTDCGQSEGSVSTANPVCCKTRKHSFSRQPGFVVSDIGWSRRASARTLKRSRAGYPMVNQRKRARGSAFSGGSSFVARMKPADLRYRHDPPHFRWLNRSRFGRVLVHGKMLPRLRIRLLVNRFRS